ncbi:MAG: aldolase/citrate lyase family protein [Dysosmobacter sp.]
MECLGRTGLDYVIIDTEHCAVGVEFLTAAITAADAAGITPLVRINEISPGAVRYQPLDYGARVLIVPAVETQWSR